VIDQRSQVFLLAVTVLLVQRVSAYSVDLGEDSEAEDEAEKVFCRGSQCRKQFSIYTQQKHAGAGSKKGQKQKGKWSKLVLNTHNHKTALAP
jgi:hypothetical protein